MMHCKHLEKAESLSQKETLLALNKIEKKFGKKLQNPTVVISSKKLFLQLAATWIPKSDQNSTEPSIIQVHPKLLKGKKTFSSTYFVSYSLDEVLGHEFVHLIRDQLFSKDEQLGFEEVLAYQTSASKLRRFLGPLFSKPSDILWLVPLFLSPLWALALPDMLFISWLGLGILLAKLVCKQWAFRKAKKTLMKRGEQNPLHTLIGLKDREIWNLAFRNTDTPIA